MNISQKDIKEVYNNLLHLKSWADNQVRKYRGTAKEKEARELVEKVEKELEQAKRQLIK